MNDNLQNGINKSNMSMDTQMGYNSLEGFNGMGTYENTSLGMPTNSRFSNMSTEDLNDLLNFGKSRITEAEVLEIESILASRRREEDEVDTLGRGNSQVQAKRMSLASEPFKSKGREDDAGYINIIILMLTVWATCLCGMAYVYSQLSVMG